MLTCIIVLPIHFKYKNNSRTKIERLNDDAADLDDLQKQLVRMNGLSGKLVRVIKACNLFHT
jgi:hypothetical protein